MSLSPKPPLLLQKGRNVFLEILSTHEVDRDTEPRLSQDRPVVFGSCTKTFLAWSENSFRSLRSRGIETYVSRMARIFRLPNGNQADLLIGLKILLAHAAG